MPYSPRCYLHQVHSAMGPLTAVFGMGTGVTSPLWPPKHILIIFLLLISNKTGIKKKEYIALNIRL